MRSYLPIVVTALLAACATPPAPEPRMTAGTDAIDDQSRNIGMAARPTTGRASIDQIDPASPDEMRQLLLSLDESRQVSVDQLQAYKDLCADAVTPPPEGIDCSEMRLRVERAFESEDDFDRALLLLDSLTRQSLRDDDTRLVDAVRDGRNFSYSPELLMGADTVAPPQPDPPEAGLSPEAAAALEAIVVTRQP